MTVYSFTVAIGASGYANTPPLISLICLLGDKELVGEMAMIGVHQEKLLSPQRLSAGQQRVQPGIGPL